MSHPGFPAPASAPRRTGFGWFNLGLWLALLLVGAILILSITMAGLREQDTTSVASGVPGFKAAGQPGRFDLDTIPGFRRRGSTFIGELHDANGALVRMVFDAKTHTLIGMNTLSAPPHAAGSGGQRGLPTIPSVLPIPAAPLPLSPAPAN